MDWTRFMRAMEARRVSEFEDRRLAFVSDGKPLSFEDKETLVEHERILSEFRDRLIGEG